MRLKPDSHESLSGGLLFCAHQLGYNWVMDLRNKKLVCAAQWSFALLFLFLALQAGWHRDYWGAAGFTCGTLFYAAMIWRESNRRPKNLSE
jgi:hypothetical protein